MNTILRIIEIIKAISIRIVAYTYLHLFERDLLKESIWLVCEKRTEARDNGYWFFKWLKENEEGKLSFYAITEDSADRYKLEQYNGIITFDSFKHYVYALAAKYSISSQPFGADPSASDERVRKITRPFYRKDQIIIHLKHGVHINNTGHYLDWPQSRIDMLCCVSKREQNFLHETFKYPFERIPITGFCRYDNLHSEHMVNKTILIMPTSRNWLSNNLHNDTQDSNHIDEFKKSQFYLEYANLLANKELLELLKKTGYNVIFYPHYALQNMIDAFRETENEYITLASRKNYDVQQLLMTSAVLITDYSSIFFDFGYMKKPLAYFQFDYDEFRKKRYAEGYFSYQDDGFGPVVSSSHEVVNFLKETINCNQAKMCTKYEERVNKFFFHWDNVNCKRVYDAILNINKTS